MIISREEYDEAIHLEYKVVDEDNRVLEETYDLSTAIDEADEIQGAVLRPDGTEAWNSKWIGTVLCTNRK